MPKDFTTLQKWVKASWRAQGAWREHVEDDFAFVAGHQWTDEEKADLEEKARAAIVFNRTSVIISAVAGSEINNRTEVRYIPREIGDVKPNEILTAGGEWFRDQADAEDSDSEAFFHLLVCGLGVTETTLDFDEDPEGEPCIKVIDPVAFGWDEFAREKGLRDARYFFEVQERPTSEMLERFPKHEFEEINATWIDAKAKGDKHETIIGDQYTHGEGASEENTDTVTVVRIQYKERIRMVETVDPMTGQRVEFSQEKFDMMSRMLPEPLPHRQLTRWEWRQAFLGAREILEENQPDKEGATFSVMTGSWDRKEKMFYGLLRSMKDPQKYANKWLTQSLHILNSNAKGGVVVETDAVVDMTQFEESWAAADGVTHLQPGGIGKIQEKPKAQFPAAFMQLTEFAVSAIRDASGVNMELLGLRDQNQPGILEYQRKQAAMSTLAAFFDSLRFYRKMQGRTIFNFLRNYIAPSGRLVRIVKEDQQQYVPLVAAMDTKKYDVIIDDAPTSTNEKERAWSVIQALLPMLQNAGLALEDWADLLEYSPLPSSFAEKVRAKAEEQAKKEQEKAMQPDPAQEMLLASMQADVEKKKSEVAENQANAALDYMKAGQVSQDTALAPIKVMQDMQRAAPPLGGF